MGVELCKGLLSQCMVVVVVKSQEVPLIMELLVTFILRDRSEGVLGAELKWEVHCSHCFVGEEGGLALEVSTVLICEEAI